MNQETTFQKTRSQTTTPDIISMSKLISMMVRNWYWFAIALVIAGSGAYFTMKYTLPSYYVSSTILIEEGDNSTLPGINSNMLEGFGLRPGSQNLDNQILILTSWTLIRKTLDKLPFDSDVYKKGLLKEVSYFPLSPITLIQGQNGFPENTEFEFHYYRENIFRLTYQDEFDIECDTFIAFGQELEISDGSFSILPIPELEDMYKSGNKIYFIFTHKDILLESYMKRLNVATATKDGTILRLSLEGPNKAKDILFLDKLVEVYVANNLEKKNLEASRIIEFIDAQLIDVSDSLMLTENQLQEFRSKNRIMDVSAQAQQIIDRALIHENEKARLTLEANYYNYLDEYLAKENTQEAPISPATMGIQDPLLGRLMQELSGLQAEYFSSGVGERNPLQNQLELRIKNTKQSLRETLQGIILANSMAMDDILGQIRTLNSQASGLPIKERQLLGFERKFNLNNVLYTFLLQKRAEAQMQKASNMPDYELIEPSRADFDPISPNRLMVYLFAVMMGLGFPLFVLILRTTINNKISSEEDLRSISDLPIVGHILHSRLSYNTVVLNEPQSRIAESFRSLRTRMEFFTKQAKSPVIMITSSMSGDGKTFASINLASAYSLAGKKTLLIGFDLRRPTLSQSFSANGDAGLSTYLIGKSSLDEIIFETEFPNLYLIPSGPIPPNPGELSSSEKAVEMFSKLRDMYDFIIVDSAPIGAVADNYSIARIADATLIMARHNQTNRKFLRATIMEAQAHGVSGLSLIVNDLRSKRSSDRYVYNYDYKQKKGSN